MKINLCRKSFLWIWCAVALACLLVSCGAHSPRVLDERYRSVHIPVLKNQTMQYALEEGLTHRMIEAFQRDGRLRVVPRSAADLELVGRITMIDISPLAYSDLNRAVGYNMSIEISVDAIETASGEPLFEDKPFRASGVFILSNEPTGNRSRDVSDTLSEAVLSFLLEGW